MNAVQLQKHLSFNFSPNLILAQVCIQNHPAADGASSAGEGGSENQDSEI